MQQRKLLELNDSCSSVSLCDKPRSAAYLRIITLYLIFSFDTLRFRHTVDQEGRATLVVFDYQVNIFYMEVSGMAWKFQVN